MKKIKTFKYKTNGLTTLTSGTSNGLFTKISKRYSSVSFLRSNPGRQAGTQQPVSTGSYDMTGHESEDLKREIGAPVLISKTRIDSDTTDCYVGKRINDLDAHAASEKENVVPNLNDIQFSFHADSPEIYDVPTKQPLRSKSASNLHKSELKVFLHKAPSLEIDPKPLNLSDNEQSNCDVPCRVAEPIKNSFNNINTERSASAQSTSDRSRLTVDHYEGGHKLRKSSSSSSKCPDEYYDESGEEEDFDMKSASFQSLDAKNLFISIEELNEITRQINESEEFSTDLVDLEYCEHRDKLKPDQRRITLLRNKSTGQIIDLEGKKEKLTNAWSGLKHWIGEERVKLKDAMQKHAAMQRVHNGGSLIAGSIAESSEQKKDEEGANSSHVASSSTSSSHNNNNLKLNLNMDSEQVQSDEIEPKIHASARVSEDKDHTMIPGFIQTFINKTNQPSITAGTSPITEGWEGQNGFEELRRYVKQGGDFAKDLVSILQERADSEQLYSKSLSKMASKLNKVCREIPGSLADAWRGVATEMESRSEVHRVFSDSMTEEIVKPLKVILENQHKTRKAIEAAVEKSARILSEWRTTEAKAKKSSHGAARENEKLQDAMLDVRIQRSPSIAMLNHPTTKSPEKEIKSAEKDCIKLDNKRRKAEETVKKADVEYYTLCIRAERARVEWEMTVLRGSTILQSHENHRLSSLKNYLDDYIKFSNKMNPSMNQIMERLQPRVNACNVDKDLNVVKNIRRASEGPSEQLLPDFYCEHTTLAMNRERRKHALVKLLQLVRTDLDRERKSRNGLKELSQSLKSTENQNIKDKLYHIRSMLTYLEGARFKLQSALLELDHKPRGSHPLAAHIQITRDRTGLQQSILKVPLWLRNVDEADQLNQEHGDVHDVATSDVASEHCVDGRNEALIKHFDRNFNRSKSNLDFRQKSIDSPMLTGNGNRTASPVFDRGIADGGSNQPDSDFDEFSSQDEDEEQSQKKQQLAATRHSITVAPVVISRCRALYSYSPKLYDELELNPGDLINVHTKQEDGWWLGELKNKIGIFPATYVEEFE